MKLTKNPDQIKWIKQNCPGLFETDPPEIDPNGYKLAGQFKWINSVSYGMRQLEWNSFKGIDFI